MEAAIIRRKSCCLEHPRSKEEVENLQSIVGDSCKHLHHCVLVGLEQDLRDREVGYVDCDVGDGAFTGGHRIGPT